MQRRCWPAPCLDGAPTGGLRARLQDLERRLAPLGPDAGLAIVCGRISGVVVVDLDDESAIQWARKHLPATPWKTKTSRGEHWFCALPDDPAWSPPKELPHKGQVQADGRYVVAPGSCIPTRIAPNEAIGDWLAPKSSLAHRHGDPARDPCLRPQ